MNFYLNFIKDKPGFITEESINYSSLMGSRAYGTATKDSDWDYYGFCIPPLEIVFPHTIGNINGFGKQVQEFNQFQAQHIVITEDIEVDVTIYNIVQYFQLCMNGNPNMIDSIFTPKDCIIKMDNIGLMVRENNSLFLSQKCYHTFRGMAHSHMSRLMNRERIGKRKELVDKFDYDVKDASHIIRLMLELNDILFTGHFAMNRYSQTIKDIKNGEWSKEEIIERFNLYMSNFENGKEKFVVPYYPDEKAIKQLLVNCLEEKFGNLSKIGFSLLIQK